MILLEKKFRIYMGKKFVIETLWINDGCNVRVYLDKHPLKMVTYEFSTKYNAYHKALDLVHFGDIHEAYENIMELCQTTEE